MPSLKKRAGLVLSDAVFTTNVTASGYYDVEATLAAGGGVITETNDSLLDRIRNTVDETGIPIVYTSAPLLPGPSVIPDPSLNPAA